ncbi:unnamed protein product, partial [Acanthoscelides obtectus]
MKWSAYS